MDGKSAANIAHFLVTSLLRVRSPVGRGLSLITECINRAHQATSSIITIVENVLSTIFLPSAMHTSPFYL